MTILSTRFKTVARAVCVVAAMGATTLSAAPAFAQEAPAFNFSLQLPGGDGGNGGATTFGRRGQGNDGGYGNDGRYERGHGHSSRCLSNREVRRGIAAYGFRNVDVTREFRRDRVEVVGQYGNWLYSMRVDKCSGEVDRVERVRRARGGGSSGFGLQFNFGN